MTPRAFRALSTLAGCCLLTACGDDSRADNTDSQGPGTAAESSGGTTTPTTAPTTGSGPDTGDTTDSPTTATTDDSPVTTTTSGGVSGCAACRPEQFCVDDTCVDGCQGVEPDPCGPAQVCDVISGTCKDVDSPCTLAGASVACDGVQCGPGTVCDGQGACIAVAPCVVAECAAGHCWGAQCGCERKVECADPPADLLNGPFSQDIAALDFADDCTAWAVTVSGGQESVRRLGPPRGLGKFPAIGDFDLGEVRVLRHLTIPQLTAPPPLAALPAPPTPIEGYGEVAVTYICCPTCGDCANNPGARGVAHLVEEDLAMPLPIVIFAEATQGDGPFGEKHLDGGPAGLTWGKGRVLYVGNAAANGGYSRAGLPLGTSESVFTFDARVTASAPVSDVHILVAVLGGGLHRFNTLTGEAEFVVDLMADVTSLSHDAFSGHVYAGLATLEVVRVHPFTGAVEPFAMMPTRGRVAVSPSGALWYAPVAYLQPGTISAWPLPTTL